MKSVNLDQPETEVFTTNVTGVKFLLLGEEEPAKITRQAQQKIRRTRRGSVRKLWGTLGMADDSRPIWKGRLLHSRVGNRESTAARSYDATMEEIAHVYEGRNPAINADKRRAKVLERFLSFDDVTFPKFPRTFSLAQIPKLRLTLMLEGDEGALVFYQYTPRGRRDAKTTTRRLTTFPQYHEWGKYAQVVFGKPHDDGSTIEYIQPHPTAGHDCSRRDRLTYTFPILPPFMIEAANKSETRFRLSNKKRMENFTIKVLTFKRENSSSITILDRMGYHLQGHSHQLLIWNPGTHQFEVRDGTGLDGSKKTLMLIHGTFSETILAFRGLIEGGNNSWLAKRMGSGRGQYQQIIGFDHPTLSEGPDQTVDAFVERLPRGFYFHQPVDFISHSRGGLVGKWFVLKQPFPVDKGALVACANGVGYFKAGWYVAKGLSAVKWMLKGIGHPVLSYITGVAQHSAEVFLKLPGCEAMTPGSDALAAVIRTKPPTPVEYLPVIGDFTKKVVRGEQLFKRLKAYGLDLLIKPILGRQHDWVVGTKKQIIIPPGTMAAGYNEGKVKRQTHAARHSDYFYKNRTKAQRHIETFLRR